MIIREMSTDQLKAELEHFKKWEQTNYPYVIDDIENELSKREYNELLNNPKNDSTRSY